MMSLTISSEPNARAEDIDAVKAGLLAFNEAHVGPANTQAVNLIVRDGDGMVVGGLIGGWRWGWLYVDKLWVREDLRGQGIGSRLLRQAEDEARAAGCVAAALDTFAFQARPFYEKLGYTVWAELPDYPPGFGMYFLRKPLTG